MPALNLNPALLAPALLGWLLSPAGALAAETITFQYGASPEATYTEVYDANIKLADAATPPSRIRYLELNYAEPGQRYICFFDLSAIPAGAQITEARLEYSFSAIYSGQTPVGIFQVATDWLAGNPWTHAGGDWIDVNGQPQGYAPFAGVTAVSSGRHSWDVTALVQRWVGGGAPNFGFLMIADKTSVRIRGSAVDALSSTSAPKLIVTFESSASDTTPPLLSAIAAGEITAGSAAILWDTDEPATSAVDYGPTAAYGATESNAGLTLNHSVALSGLEAGREYHYRVRSADAAGNTATDADRTFVTSSVPGAALLSDDFNDGDFAGWTVVDEGAVGSPSAWRVSNGVLVQQSNIYGGDPNNKTDPNKPGTYLAAGSASAWRNYRLALRLRSADDDGIGVMFRYRDANNYYRFAMDKQRAYRRLTRTAGGVITVLWQDGGTYAQGQWYPLEIAARDAAITIKLNGAALYEGADTSPLLEGGIALYSWGNDGAAFDDVLVESLDPAGPDATPPVGSITINGGAPATNNHEVSLTLEAHDAQSAVVEMRFANEASAYSLPEPYAAVKTWTLSDGDGGKSVSARFRDAAGNWSDAVNAAIIVDTVAPSVSITSHADGQIIQP